MSVRRRPDVGPTSAGPQQLISVRRRPDVGWTSAGRRNMRAYPTSSRRRAEVGPTSGRRRHADAELPTSPRRRPTSGRRRHVYWDVLHMFPYKSTHSFIILFLFSRHMHILRWMCGAKGQEEKNKKMIYKYNFIKFSFSGHDKHQIPHKMLASSCFYL